MRAEFWAVLTAVCWACGSFFEKKGVKLGGFAPVMGTTIRTAGLKPILMIAIAGGVFAGALGILFFYQALSLGALSIVLPLAFCLTPVIGVILGGVLLGEKLLPIQYVGITLTIAGATITAYFR